MKLPAYPRYKHSGVAWLGDVPEHWGVKQLRHSASLKSGKIVTRYMADRDFQGSAFPILAREIFEAVRERNSSAPAASVAP
jgi:hypothetical protein